MCSQVSVCHSVLGEVGPHVTITRDALDLTVQHPPPPDMGHGDPHPWPYSLLVTSDGHRWRPG